MSLHNSEDRVLLKLYCQHGDKTAFGVIYQRYVTMVLSVCIKYVKNEALAEDLTQQVFEKLLRIVCKHEITYFKSWLYQTSRNHCLMYLRKNNPLDYNQELALHQATEEPSRVSEKIEKEKKYQRLEDAIEKLKPEHKQCLKLFYIEKMSYNQIQEKTGWSFKEVKSHLQNAKRNLKIALNDS